MITDNLVRNRKCLLPLCITVMNFGIQVKRSTLKENKFSFTVDSFLEKKANRELLNLSSLYKKAKNFSK